MPRMISKIIKTLVNTSKLFQKKHHFRTKEIQRCNLICDRFSLPLCILCQLASIIGTFKALIKGWKAAFIPSFLVEKKTIVSLNFLCVV